MKKMWTLFLAGVLVFGSFAVAADKKKDKDKNQPAQTQPAPPVKSPEQIAAEAEEAIVQQIQAMTDPAEQVKLLEDYCQKYAASPNYPWARFTATMAYQRLNNFEKMEEHGKVAMQVIPNNPVLLAVMADGYAENHRLAEAEACATKAMEAVGSITKPPDAGADFDQQITMLKGTIQSTFGNIFLQQGTKLDKKDPKREELLNKALENFKLAVAASKTDDISYYRMGVTYAMMAKWDDSLSNYAKAVAVNRSVAAQSKADIEKIIDALTKANQIGDRTYDQLIAQAKKDLGV